MENAPEPDDIIWENLNISPLNRAVRKLLTFMITIGFILSSALCLYYLAILRKEWRIKGTY